MTCSKGAVALTFDPEVWTLFFRKQVPARYKDTSSWMNSTIDNYDIGDGNYDDDDRV